MLFVGRWGSLALALSFSVAAIINATLLYVFLRRRIEAWCDRAFFRFVGKVSLASVTTLLAVQSGKFFFGLGNVELDTFVEVFLELVLSGVLGMVAFVLSAWVLKIEELESVRCFIVSRFVREPQVLKEAEEESARGPA